MMGVRIIQRFLVFVFIDINGFLDNFLHNLFYYNLSNFRHFNLLVDYLLYNLLNYLLNNLFLYFHGILFIGLILFFLANNFYLFLLGLFFELWGFLFDIVRDLLTLMDFKKCLLLYSPSIWAIRLMGKVDNFGVQSYFYFFHHIL